jgi:hypothetical protein
MLKKRVAVLEKKIRTHDAAVGAAGTSLAALSYKPLRPRFHILHSCQPLLLAAELVHDLLDPLFLSRWVPSVGVPRSLLSWKRFGPLRLPKGENYFAMDQSIPVSRLHM